MHSITKDPVFKLFMVLHVGNNTKNTPSNVVLLMGARCKRAN